MISARARARRFFFGVFLFEKFGCENLMCLYVFVTSDLEILTKLVVLEGFRYARAAERA